MQKLSEKTVLHVFLDGQKGFMVGLLQTTLLQKSENRSKSTKIDHHFYTFPLQNDQISDLLIYFLQ